MNITDGARWLNAIELHLKLCLYCSGPGHFSETHLATDADDGTMFQILLKYAQRNLNYNKMKWVRVRIRVKVQANLRNYGGQ